MADDWIGISSAHLLPGGAGVGFCGQAESSGFWLTSALDGTGYWRHDTDHAHWAILDLGETYTIKKVRGRSNSTVDPTDVDIYVSDDMGAWGEAVATGISTWQDCVDPFPWQEVVTVQKDGRYIKVVINSSEYSNWIAWGYWFPAFTIFDAYGSVAVGVAAPTVSTVEADPVEVTTATGKGNITDIGGENCDHRGIVYGKTSKGDPGGTAYNATAYDNFEDESDGFGTGPFSRNLTGLDPDTQYYFRAYAHNSAGYSYGDELDFTTGAAPEGVPAIYYRTIMQGSGY